MALVKCHECGKDVSTEAKVCPSCGAKVVKPKEPKKPMSPIIKYSLLGVVGFIFINTYLQSQSPEDVEAKANHENIGMAEVVCKMAFEKNAKNPDSVDWIRAERQFQFTNAEKTTAISTQPVRAKNSFNATVKSVAVCELEKKGDKWELVSIKEQK
ncbi:zinc ribbon domain-containing protein [Methylotenera sp.]|uniref:zinc ribbon domain-containing protein n=1 Tax=Methylotenera sp. TaxID=2051956 RepID=UPI0026006437|nr:zinc ribbon domain-containing protein [Methylotenera sp.]